MLHCSRIFKTRRYSRYAWDSLPTMPYDVAFTTGDSVWTSTPVGQETAKMHIHATTESAAISRERDFRSLGIRAFREKRYGNSLYFFIFASDLLSQLRSPFHARSRCTCWSYMAQCCIRLGIYQDAVHYATLAFSEDSSFLPTMHIRGTAYFHLGMLEESLSDFNSFESASQVPRGRIHAQVLYILSSAIIDEVSNVAPSRDSSLPLTISDPSISPSNSSASSDSHIDWNAVEIDNVANLDINFASQMLSCNLCRSGSGEPSICCQSAFPKAPKLPSSISSADSYDIRVSYIFNGCTSKFVGTYNAREKTVRSLKVDILCNLLLSSEAEILRRAPCMFDLPLYFCSKKLCPEVNLHSLHDVGCNHEVNTFHLNVNICGGSGKRFYSDSSSHTHSKRPATSASLNPNPIFASPMVSISTPIFGYISLCLPPCYIIIFYGIPTLFSFHFYCRFRL